MTNKLEKQFFDTFGVEPNCQNEFINPSKCPFNESRVCYGCVSFQYPQITDRILLELICVINRFDIYFDYYYQEEYQVLRETILEDSINLNCKLKQTDFSKLKHQVQALFDEG